MNAQMIRQNYGVKQITLQAMSGRKFNNLIDSLDAARYPEHSLLNLTDKKDVKEAGNEIY
ncbi:TPA: hypothetical protein JG847_004913 [Vibrio parahaemolyticus]|nr:hypothetical protein [Vibrio parahaemolyticus]